MSSRHTWLDHPEKAGLRQVLFQLHLWIGAAVSAYIFAMSVSGSVLVFRNELSNLAWVEWLVRFHSTLLAGASGRLVNGVGAACLIVLTLTGGVIWWPGRAHWRRSLTVDWSARFPRVNWDLHSASGFWFLPFVLIWSVSGAYFAYPAPFDWLIIFDRSDRFVDPGLYALTQLHFGRFNPVTEAIWALAGLVPAVLAFTGLFICCRRIMFSKPSNPKNAVP